MMTFWQLIPIGPEDGKIHPVSPRLHSTRCGLQALLFVILLFEEAFVSADVPINGRKQNMVFPREEVHAIAAAAYDRTLKDFIRQGKLDRDKRLFQRVQHIAGRVIAQAIVLKPEAARWDWQVHVATTEVVDAYCMAGGKILLGSAFLRNEELMDDELAALLAHEVAHAIAEHVREQLSEARLLSPAYARFNVEDVIAILDWDLSISIKLEPLSRLEELEADDIGIYLAAKAGFDPQALVQFYRKLARSDRGRAFFHTHGASDQRAKIAEAFAAYAEPLYEASLARGRVPEYVFH
jgi:predicted Zn-dependent protease